MKWSKKATQIAAAAAMLLMMAGMCRGLGELLEPLGAAAPMAIALPALAGEETRQEHEEREKIAFEVLRADEDVPEEIKIELLELKAQPIELEKENPSILIYHTHTTEAYNPRGENPYTETDEWRTDDNSMNIVRVGEELARLLREEYGLNVLHDTTDHEPPKLGTAYVRSLETMEKYHEEYPSIDLFIDVHRDAYNLPEGETENDDYVEINGEKVARAMFVVGTGEGQTGAGFSEKPNYKENYALALSISEQLKEVDSRLARPIRVKTGRYNQHIPGRALLVEVGHNYNSLGEALRLIPYLAEAIAKAAGAA